ncbi:MAG: hypothetical protein WA994_02165 [Ornithinimicrobium sp.]
MSAWSGGEPFVGRLGDDVGMILGGEVTATGNVPDLRPKVDGQTLAEAELLERVGRTPGDPRRRDGNLAVYVPALTIYADHWIHQERSEETNQAITRWLERRQHGR